MFELPGTKVVSRTDLLPARMSSPAPEQEPDPDTVALAEDTFRRLFGKPEALFGPLQGQAQIIADPAAASKAQDKAEEQEQEFEFRLFAQHNRVPTDGQQLSSETTKTTTTATTTAAAAAAAATPTLSSTSVDEQLPRLRIRLRSPTPSSLEPGGFVVPFRGWDYYFSDPRAILADGGRVQPSADAAGNAEMTERKASFAAVAVSSADVRARAKGQRSVMHLSWRVITLKPAPLSRRQRQRLQATNAALSSSSIPNSTTTAPTTASSIPIPLVPAMTAEQELLAKKKRKSKPGKKRRVVLRQRAARTAAEAAGDREKRAQRNRGKKLKRRARDRERKRGNGSKGQEMDDEGRAEGEGDENGSSDEQGES